MLTEKQKELRKTGIGGSDAAAIAGLSRYKSNIDVYLVKLGLKADDAESEAAYWGSIFEKDVAIEYVKRTGKKVLKHGKLLRHKKYTWMIANVDRIIKGEHALLECKTCSAFKYKEWGADGSDEIPEEYLIQCAHYAIVYDAKYVDIAVLMGGQHFGIYTYQRNKKLESSLIEIEHDFWHNHILAQEPPQPKTYADATKLFSDALGNAKEATEEIEKEYYKYANAHQKIKELYKQANQHKTTICNYLANDSILIGSMGTELATWKNKTIKRFDVEQFKRKHPKLYNQFLNAANSREFRIKGVINE